MKSLIAGVVLVTVMTMLPALIHANPINTTANGLAYCNRSDDHPVTTTHDVCVALFDGLTDIDRLCTQDEMQCRVLPKKNVTIEANVTLINDQVNAKLEFMLGRLQKIIELCETEEAKLFSGEESLTTLCNMLKCRTKLVINNVTQYLIDERCGCAKGCHYTPGRFIEFDQETTVSQLLDIIYGDFSFLFCVFFRIIQASMSPNPELTICDDVNLSAI